ncbi:MAG: DUF3119 family protein [Cyanobacteria bacterium P01_F01_bin.42]
MTELNTNTVSQDETMILAPSFALPLGFGAIALPLYYWAGPWAALLPGILAVFLAIQAATLRIHFTKVALELYRGDKQLRYFPYDQWMHWEIFFGPVPILFYFKEIRSIHFLPILFNPEQLKTALVQRCPKADAAPQP